MVALFQKRPGRCYCFPRYTVVVYFCGCTEMEISVVAAPQHPNSFPPPTLTLSSQGESFLLLPRASLPAQSPFHPIPRWRTRGEEVHQPEGHQPASWKGFGWVPPESGLRRGSMGVNLDSNSPTQHLGSPTVSPDYQLSRSSTAFHAGTRHREQSHDPKQTKSPLAQPKIEEVDQRRLETVFHR